MSIKADFNLSGQLNQTESLTLNDIDGLNYEEVDNFVLITTDAHGLTTGNLFFFYDGEKFRCSYVNGEDGYIESASLLKNQSTGKWRVQLDNNALLNVYVIGFISFR